MRCSWTTKWLLSRPARCFRVPKRAHEQACAVVSSTQLAPEHTPALCATSPAYHHLTVHVAERPASASFARLVLKLWLAETLPPPLVDSSSSESPPEPNQPESATSSVSEPDIDGTSALLRVFQNHQLQITEQRERPTSVGVAACRTRQLPKPTAQVRGGGVRGPMRRRPAAARPEPHRPEPASHKHRPTPAPAAATQISQQASTDFTPRKVQLLGQRDDHGAPRARV